MPKTVEAIFENGVFRPLDSSEIAVREGERVLLLVQESLSAESGAARIPGFLFSFATVDHKGDCGRRDWPQP